MKLAKTKTFNAPYTMWRVEVDSVHLYWGPWCYTRRNAVLNWLFANLRIRNTHPIWKLANDKIPAKPTPAVPDTLTEAVELILHSTPPKDLTAFAHEDGDCPGSSFHFSGGMAMRNDWGLWHGTSGVSRYLRENRIFHGDDQSATIFKAVWCRLNGVKLDLPAEARKFEEHWNRQGLTWDMKPMEGHPLKGSFSLGTDLRPVKAPATPIIIRRCPKQ
jgi:hypothetical protein